MLLLECWKDMRSFEEDVALIESYLKDHIIPRNRVPSIQRKSKNFTLREEDGALVLYYVGPVGDPHGLEPERVHNYIPTETEGPRPGRKVVANTAEQQRLLKKHHEENGHFGRNRMRALLSQRFYWPGIIKDIDFYVKMCRVCQRTGMAKEVKKRPRPHRIPVKKKSVWDEVGIDLIGPLKETPQGNCYIVTLTDYLSKWAEAAAIKDKQATTVATFILSVMHRFGFPASIITDQDSDFNSALMTALCSMTNCQLNVTCPSRPQCRYNKALITGLQKVTNNADDWDKKLDSFMFEYRSIVQESKKKSPFEIMFKRQPRIPPDVADTSSDAPNAQSSTASITTPQDVDAS